MAEVGADTEGGAAVEIGTCPSCGESVRGDGLLVRCNCSWSGHVLRFRPAPRTEVKGPETATPEDVTCANHPAKAATAICAGTGNYICSLCAVEVNGQVFSAEFLEADKSKTRSPRFDRTLERPDRYQGLLLVLSLLFLWWASPIVLIIVVFLFVRHLNLRKTNELYRQVSSHTMFIVNMVVFGALSLLVTPAYISFFSVMLEEL